MTNKAQHNTDTLSASIILRYRTLPRVQFFHLRTQEIAALEYPCKGSGYLAASSLQDTSPLGSRVCCQCAGDSVCHFLRKKCFERRGWVNGRRVRETPYLTEEPECHDTCLAK